MFCEHVGLFRLSSAEVQGQTRHRTPHCLLSEPARPGRVAKNEKKPTPIDDGLHAATPSNDCDQVHASVPILGTTCPPHSPLSSHQLLVRSFASSFTSLWSVAILAPICCSDSGLPVLASTFRDNHYLCPAISAASMHSSHILHIVQSLRLWVYHRDFGATLSVIYGK
jgi:hypothetical protein